MNRFTLIFLAAAVAAFSASRASAATIYEPFAYSNGPLAGNTNSTAPATLNGFSNTNVWTASATSPTGTVISGDLSYTNLPTTATGHMGQVSSSTGNPVRLGIGEYGEGSSIYFSMLVQVPSGVTNFGSSTTTGSFFAGFQYNPSTLSGATMTDTTAGAGGVLTVHKATDGLGYNLGIAYRDAPAATSRVFDNAHEFKAGDVVYLVGRWDLVAGSQNDVASLFVNPDPTQPEPATPNAVSRAIDSAAGSSDYLYTTGATPSQLETKIRSFFLRSNGVEPTNMNIDEIRIGASWEEATGQVIVVPEPTAIALMVIAAFGASVLRRRSV
jgi:hypothetical protein